MTDSYPWQIRDISLTPGRPVLVMGIVNVTPDSFSDGGQFFTSENAIQHGLELIRQGANLLDIGGESTRPGSKSISAEEQLARILPVVRGLHAQSAIALSIDTTSAIVAEECLKAGAHIINDITALQGDPNMCRVVRQYEAGLILMHMQGTPETMQINPTYTDVLAEVISFLQARLQTATDNGIALHRIAIDPGIGFGKKFEHNLELLARLDDFGILERPLCLGVSRKGFLGQLLGRSVDDRLAGSLATACHALAQRSVHILRVHDVQPTRDAVGLFATLQEQRARRASTP